ncbi:MAG TPA: ABC transporter ATP-binding protein [Rhodoblastus sp.]|nr:ABC transporter ATP-binding protein [Rhodoblastus sp.]
MKSVSLIGIDLSFRRGERAVLSGASLSIQSGEVVALLGANGSGKTTLLRLLMGFLKPASGKVFLDGDPLEKLSRRAIARKIAYVAQNHAAPFPYLVRDVVALGRLPQSGWYPTVRAHEESAVDQALRRLRISHLAQRPYTEISGGERQLALLGRALAQGAEILVLDEPMSGLDYGAQLRLIALLRGLAAEGRGVVMSTHHPEHAHWACDRVAMLEMGRISEDGPPDEVLTAAAIERLYGVKVETLETAAGRRAFAPFSMP